MTKDLCPLCKYEINTCKSMNVNMRQIKNDDRTYSYVVIHCPKFIDKLNGFNKYLNRKLFRHNYFYRNNFCTLAHSYQTLLASAEFPLTNEARIFLVLRFCKWSTKT